MSSITINCFFTIFVISAVNSQSVKFSPVILVPGYGGSKLYARSLRDTTDPCQIGQKWTLLWFKLQNILPSHQQCFSREIRLYYNRLLKKTQNFAGLDIDSMDWGGTNSIDYIGETKTSFENNFATLSNYLVQNGYVRNQSLRGAPYDFRITPDTNSKFMTRFKALVEDTYNRNDATKVMVLGHSMGNLYVNYFLSRMTRCWKAKFLRGYVAVAPPLGGSVYAVLAETTGLGSNINFLDMNNIRSVLRSFPSTGVNFPSPLFWSHHDVFARRPGREYTVSNIHQLFRDVNNEDGWEMYKNSMNLVTTRWQPDLDEVYCMYGIDVKTPEKLEWETDSAFPDSQPKIHYGNGDGTVNKKSLKACEHWYGVRVMKYSGATHRGVLKDLRFLSDVLYLLRQL